MRFTIFLSLLWTFSTALIAGNKAQAQALFQRFDIWIGSNCLYYLIGKYYQGHLQVNQSNYPYPGQAPFGAINGCAQQWTLKGRTADGQPLQLNENIDWPWAWSQGRWMLLKDAQSWLNQHTAITIVWLYCLASWPYIILKATTLMGLAILGDQIFDS